jgi:GAF domain
MTPSAFRKSSIPLGANKNTSVPDYEQTGIHSLEHLPPMKSALQGILEQEWGECKLVSSAAIALAGEDGMRCRAKIGSNAPAVGTLVRPGFGLTGLCVQTGEVQLCNDVHNDSRVDVEVCERLGIGSLLVLPLKRNATVVGVLELISANANAFDEPAVAQVRSLIEAEGNPVSHLGEDPVPATATRSVDLQQVLAAAFVLQEEGGKELPDQGVQDLQEQLPWGQNSPEPGQSQTEALASGEAPWSEQNFEPLPSFSPEYSTAFGRWRAALTGLWRRGQ